MKIDIKSKGSLDLEKKLNEVIKLIESDKLLKQLTDVAYDHFMESFPTSTKALGGNKTDASAGGWVRRQGDPKHPALRKTGRLIKSIKKGKGIIFSNLDYASYQNNGGGWLPQREFIGPSKKLNSKMVKFIKNAISKILKS